MREWSAHPGARHGRRPTVLFTTPYLRHPPTTGPTLRIENSIKALARIATVHLYCAPMPPDERDTTLEFYRGYCRSLHVAPSDEPERLTRQAADLFRVAGEIQPDVIWLGFGCITYPLLIMIKRSTSYKVVADTDSVHSRFILRGLPYAQDQNVRGQILRDGTFQEKLERWGTRIADVTTAVSEIDARYYRELTPAPEHVHLFSNGVDLDVYAAPPPPAPDLTKPSVYLAGNFWHGGSPMEDASRWVIRDVLPLVLRQAPGARLYIVGNDSDKVLADVVHPAITITGTLPSVLQYLCHADVALVPLRFESGTRFKILEAGACGIPVVSTTLGAEGLPVRDGEHLLIADSAEEFAAAVTRLLTDRGLAGHLAQRLKAFVAERYSIAALSEEAAGILEYLGV
jgi:polysaccharide biosynthesis protein PslH